MESDLPQKDSIFSANKGNERRSLNKIEIVSIRILERWDEVLNIFQLWREHKIANTSREEGLRNKLRAGLYVLFLMNERLFFRRLEALVYDDLRSIILNLDGVSPEGLEESYLIMNKTLDELGLVRVDLDYKKKTLEEVNKEKGLN